MWNRTLNQYYLRLQFSDVRLGICEEGLLGESDQEKVVQGCITWVELFSDGGIGVFHSRLVSCEFPLSTCEKGLLARRPLELLVLEYDAASESALSVPLIDYCDDDLSRTVRSVCVTFESVQRTRHTHCMHSNPHCAQRMHRKQ